MTCPACGWRLGHACDCPLRSLPACGRLDGMQDAKTMPPGPADAAALEESRRLRDDRSAHFWATVERLANEVRALRAGTNTGG